MMGDEFNKMKEPVWLWCVTLLSAWEASTYTVVLKGMPLVSGTFLRVVTDPQYLGIYS